MLLLKLPKLLYVCLLLLGIPAASFIWQELKAAFLAVYCTAAPLYKLERERRKQARAVYMINIYKVKKNQFRKMKKYSTVIVCRVRTVTLWYMECMGDNRRSWKPSSIYFCYHFFLSHLLKWVFAEPASWASPLIDINLFLMHLLQLEQSNSWRWQNSKDV